MHNEEERPRADAKSELLTAFKLQLSVDVAAGFFTGVFSAALFHPWDRALFLATKNNTPFLLWENFKNPYHGFSQAIFQRAFLGSTYYVIQGELKHYAYPYFRQDLNMGEPLTQFIIGTTAGSISGLLTNSTSAIKCHTWSGPNRTFYSSAKEMWVSGHLKPFIKGTNATVMRDVVFGSTYEVMRHLMQNNLHKPKSLEENYFHFACNSMAAGFATVASGPFNYTRAIQYATPPHEKTPTSLKLLKDVFNESKQFKNLSKMVFFQQKFKVGWGTARVAIGMSVGQQVFDEAEAALKTLLKK